MRIDAQPRKAPGVDCPYLPDRSFVQRYFFADSLSGSELEALLSAGWRHFGTFFFQPACPNCRACEPVRIDVKNLRFSDSQKRVLRRNSDVAFSVVPLELKDEYYALYAHHSLVRFARDTSLYEFRENFFDQAAPSFLTEYRIEGRLAGLGFCDRSDQGLSSVYFVFHEDFAPRSLGIFSVLRECQLAADFGLSWYYLGYWVKGNQTMAYKGKFFSRQIFNWETGAWEKNQT